MNEYFPDQWMLVKVGGTDPHYRVFGSWSGGYLTGDSWRLNSGVVKCVESETYPGNYEFIGHSGSAYICSKGTYGITSLHNNGVLYSYCDRSSGTMEVLEEIPENITEMDWITSND
jgi:hypothetical protein